MSPLDESRVGLVDWPPRVPRRTETNFHEFFVYTFSGPEEGEQPRRRNVFDTPRCYTCALSKTSRWRVAGRRHARHSLKPRWHAVDEKLGVRSEITVLDPWGYCPSVAHKSESLASNRNLFVGNKTTITVFGNILLLL